MRLLIIEHGNSPDELLQEICASDDVTSMSAADLTAANDAVRDADALLLTGGYGKELIWEQPYFIHEVEVVRLAEKPVLGVGMGFELICYAFGSQLHDDYERAVGDTKVRPTDEGAKLFQGTDPLKVLAKERWTVDELPRELVVLARSESGIEAIRHKTRPVIGIQLQPGEFVYPSDAKMVFRNILDGFRKRTAT